MFSPNANLELDLVAGWGWVSTWHLLAASRRFHVGCVYIYIYTFTPSHPKKLAQKTHQYFNVMFLFFLWGGMPNWPLLRFPTAVISRHPSCFYQQKWIKMAWMSRLYPYLLLAKPPANTVVGFITSIFISSINIPWTCHEYMHIPWISFWIVGFPFSHRFFDLRGSGWNH